LTRTGTTLLLWETNYLTFDTLFLNCHFYWLVLRSAIWKHYWLAKCWVI